MEFSLQKELPGRLRVKLAGPVPAADLDALERVVLASAAVLRVTVYPRIGSLAVVYRPGEGNRRQVLAHLESIDAAAIDGARVAGGIALAPRTQSLLMELAVMIGSYAVRRWFLPRPLAAVVAAWRYRRFLMPALRSLRRARLDVPVLDAAAIGMSFARRDPKTAGETMFLLDAGETLEEYTRSRSEGALISALLDIPETAQRIEGDTEARVAATGETKLRSIVSMVEQSESLKSEAHSRMEALADRIVPWNFLLAGAVALFFRSLVKTSAALMVDYSCALKLTGSIAELSAMSQSAKLGFTVKGSKHFEAMAAADTIVFDKTGTLTEATPEVACVLGLRGWERDEVLRLSACLEEHFPHPVARAVVRAAAERGLEHRERHAAVEYIVAHGIASALDGKRVVIGSEHFVVGDEGVEIAREDRSRIAVATESLSPLYLAVDGELVGVIGVRDPLKAGVAAAIGDLRALGFERVIMLTGDNERTAARVAAEAGVTEFRADMLPEDKHGFVARLREEGRHVVMVGDGVNDAPALSLADVGIAMGQGTAIAKEVADITLTGGDLSSLVALRRLSQGLMDRLSGSLGQVMAINSALLAAGIAGVARPQVSSLLHNATTIALALRNSGKYNV